MEWEDIYTGLTMWSRKWGPNRSGIAMGGSIGYWEWS